MVEANSDGDSRPYHHGHLRSALVEAGMGLARDRGVAALGVREITRLVGVTPGAAYRHFSDFHALVLTLALEAQRHLARRMIQRMDTAVSTPDPAERAVQRLRGFGLAYIDFALTEPGWFELTCLSQEQPPDHDVHEHAAESVPPPHLLLLGVLDEMVQTGAVTSRRRVDAEWSCWSTIHGFAELATHGPLQGNERIVNDTLAARAVDTLVAGLRT